MALISVWDDLWEMMREVEKETIFPLQSDRALREENILADGLDSTHHEFGERELRPSVILSYPDDLENPQRLASRVKLCR